MADAQVPSPGLTYVGLSGTTYVLGRQPFPSVARPDRDVLTALLRYALERVEAGESRG